MRTLADDLLVLAIDGNGRLRLAEAQAIGLGDRLYAGPVRRGRRKRLNEVAERNWAGILVRRAMPGARSGPSLSWTDNQFGGLPPGGIGAGP